MRVLALVLGLGLAVSGAAPAQEPSPLEQLEQRLQAPRPAEPGWMGLTADDTDRGVEAVALAAEGPAERAGIRMGDVILKVAGVDVRTLDDFAEAVQGLPAGAHVEVQIERNERQATLLVELAARQAAKEPRPAPAAPALDDLARERPRLGIRVEPLTEALRQRHRVSAREGAYVTQVTPDSPAAKAALSVGAVIVGMNRRPVQGPADVLEELERSAMTGVVEVEYEAAGRVERKRISLAGAAPPPRQDAPQGSPAEELPPPPLPQPLPATSKLEAENKALRARVRELEEALEELRRQVHRGEQGAALPPPP